MIVGSLLLILVAVVLLVAGLVGGSSVLLIASIGASLLAAVALVVGARQVAAARAAADPTGPPARPADLRREPAATGTTSTDARRTVGPTVPTQFASATDGTGGSGWRQPPGSPVAGPEPHAPPGSPVDAPRDDDPGAAVDEPGVQEVSPADAARVARLATEVQVVDGRPRYHVADCLHLLGREPEPLPASEAVELGFTPCADCAPDTALLADSRPS
ncbi:hypothetical protein [Micromonospora sagamiensis]|uniref:hypothetical protein n=1 Tax=Micromonospora sagamiensis TaxID=47875 RepID=UPI00119CD702|nr:hypothetical protein [Micromonospora sagamiensis]BCL12949.1 hypothetical protein GCM10017556_06880 [Micromonospora sagamiensis]